MIKEIKENGQMMYVMSAEALDAFAESIIARVKSLIDDEKKNLSAEQVTLTMEEVMDRYDVSKSTLWRWKKEGYLVPDMLGRKSFYKLSEIEKVCKLKC